MNAKAIVASALDEDSTIAGPEDVTTSIVYACETPTKGAFRIEPILCHAHIEAAYSGCYLRQFRNLVFVYGQIAGLQSAAAADVLVNGERRAPSFESELFGG